jgi:hypothetical protein
LEEKFAEQEDQNSRRVNALEIVKTQLLTKLEKQEEKIIIQAKDLEKSTEQCDVLERAKDSIKREKKACETELRSMKEEFALSASSKEHLYFYPPPSPTTSRRMEQCINKI